MGYSFAYTSCYMAAYMTGYINLVLHMLGIWGKVLLELNVAWSGMGSQE